MSIIKQYAVLFVIQYSKIFLKQFLKFDKILQI